MKSNCMPTPAFIDICSGLLLMSCVLVYFIVLFSTYPSSVVPDTHFSANTPAVPYRLIHRDDATL